MKYLRFTATFVALLIVVNPSAQAADGNKNLIDNIVVTASRVPERAAQRAVSTIIINRQQIEQQNANDLADILRFHAGLDIGRNGGPGQVASVFVRGAESNHLLVMIDGVRMNPGTIGVSAIQNIDPDMIERIEVVKGPRSTLYGSDAIGGVVNVISRIDSNPRPLSFSVGGGSFDTLDLNAGTGFGHAEAGGNVSVSYQDTDGFAARAGATEDHGYKNTSIQSAGWRQFGQHRVELNLWRSHGNTEYAGFFLEPLDQDYTNQSLEARLVSTLNSQWDSSLSLSHMVDDIEQKQASFNGAFDFLTTNRVSADWQNTLALADGNQLIMGLYGHDEKAEALSFGLPIDEDTSVFASYAEYNMQREKLDASLAARYTHHDDFGTSITWHTDFGYNLTPSLQLIAAAGTGFRAPDATDRFGFGGNVNLDPEVSTTVELGFRLLLSNNHVVTVRAFDQEIDDLINYVVTDFVTFAGTNQNIDKTRTDGVEISHQFKSHRFDVRSELIWQDPEDKSTGQVLLRRAKRTFSTHVNYQLPKGNVGVSLLATGERADIDSATFGRVSNPGYVLANMNYSIPVSPHWQVRAKIENLLNTEYETADGFNSMARSFFVEFAYN